MNAVELHDAKGGVDPNQSKSAQKNDERKLFPVIRLKHIWKTGKKILFKRAR
ncbi:hypothetical protein [Rheinheimera sp.]|uniref:hypothetical protein n=1 Tax=Rheinheimera sp. TaxID=1869214 RepID=UPI004047A66F